MSNDTQELDTQHMPPSTTAPVWAPDDAWWDAYTAALTPETIADVRRYAKQALAYGSGAACEATPAELVNEAISDTAAGVGRWDPQRGALAPFLCARVRHMLWQRAKAARRIVRLDHIDDTDPQGSTLDRLLSHDEAPAARLAMRASVASAISYLRARCANDGAARAYLTARLAGHQGIPAIAAATGLSLLATRAAHMRVVRHARTLPPALQEHLAALA